MLAVRIRDVAGFVTGHPAARELKVLLSPSLHPLHNVSVGVMTLPPGNSSGLHHHALTEEMWYIISGHGQVRIGDEVQRVEPEMIVLGPPGIPHGFVNDGDEPLRALWIISPAGDEKPILDGLAAQQSGKGT
jgi:mannose-6-phosphate isomerase-like protein (cupin superfamily)